MIAIFFISVQAVLIHFLFLIKLMIHTFNSLEIMYGLAELF